MVPGPAATVSPVLVPSANSAEPETVGVSLPFVL